MLAATAATALVLAACGGGGASGTSTGSKKASGPVTITFWHGQNQSAGKVIKSLADEFNRTHPDDEGRREQRRRAADSHAARR